ncbi:MAG: PEP-CTERM sorting domain-containing protein [Puniceicoccales bacterium]|jgi:hypothetical protein|nr:PEP-CTERM sorting domain-containing protein [Puniceicoccales bacterium]
MKHFSLAVLVGASFLVSSDLIGSVTVVSFGSTAGLSFGPATVNTETPTGVGAGVVHSLANTAGANDGLGLKLDGSWASAGAGGSFQPSGNVAYDNSNAVINGWIGTYEPLYGQIWQSLSNPNGSNGAATLTLSGLAADTTYELTILSVRANSVYSGTGNYQLLYGGSASGVGTSLVAGGGNVDGALAKISGEVVGSAAGANAREMKWTFTTDSVPADAVLTLDGSAWNVNAMIISSTPIPEPSTYALMMGVGLLGLSAVRRRK